MQQKRFCVASFCVFVAITILCKNKFFEPGCSPVSRIPNQTFYEGIKITQRYELGSYLEKLKFKTGGEVGVQHGLFSKDLLQHWKSVEKFYLIDVWRKQENYNDTANVLNSEQQKIFETANENVKPWAHKIVFLRMTSTEAANQLDDNSLDFVFLDGRHDYCGLKEDLINYWPKVKLGGIVAGHDYQYAKIDNANNWGICSDGTFSVLSVKGAVNEFSATHCAFVHQLGDSWMLFK